MTGMPAVVAPEAYDLWLDCARVDAETACAVLAPAPEDTFAAYEVSTAVNRSAYDSPPLIERLAAGAEDMPQKTLRARAKPTRTTDDPQGSLF